MSDYSDVKVISKSPNLAHSSALSALLRSFISIKSTGTYCLLFRHSNVIRIWNAILQEFSTATVKTFSIVFSGL